MFENHPTLTSTGDLRGFLGALSRLNTRVDDAERIDQIRLLEEIKAAAAAAQAKATTEFVASQRAVQVDAGVLAKDVGMGIASQVALAKRESQAHARRFVGWAGILTTELPNTYEALRQGRITEWRALIVSRETGWLSAEHRATVDAELAPTLESLGDRAVEAETKKLAYRLGPQGYVGRTSKAENDRRVTLRPAPDTMSVLSGLLPVAQGVSVLASLRRHADSMQTQGDERTRGQIMADTLVERVTGQAAADAVPVEVRLVMTDQTLMNYGASSDEPATVEGYGPGARRGRATGRWHRRQEGRIVAEAALHQPENRHPGRHGVPAPTLRRRPRRRPYRPGPDLPNSMVRSADQAQGPCHRRRRRRRDLSSQRSGVVRSLQLRQAGSRLARPSKRRRSW